MKIGVVQFPGSNCSRETAMAVFRLGYEPIDCFWNASHELVQSLDGYILVGGFSFEDRVRSGVIASLEPIMQLLETESLKGKPILGICNGAQILVASLLMPPMTLANNHRPDGLGYYNDWVYIRQNSPYSTPIRLPIAHAEGRFLIKPDVYESLVAAKAMCYYYCDAEGCIDPKYPVNPNGSDYNLAAISNEAGTVMAMMPHPERTTAGDVILREFFESVKSQTNSIKTYSQANALEFLPYEYDLEGLHYWVSLLIDDNEALSLQNVLAGLNLPIKIKKYTHWHLHDATLADDKIIRENEELFNLRKEYLVNVPLDKPEPRPSGSGFSSVVRPLTVAAQTHTSDVSKSVSTYIIQQKQDDLAQTKGRILSQQLGHTIHIVRETVWAMSGVEDVLNHVHTLMKEKALLGHPLSHKGFFYHEQYV